MVKSGFFNSLKDSSGNADRTYGAADFSEIFKGIITDGVYEHVGECFKIENVTNDELTVKSGRCWLNGCWMSNTEDLVLSNKMASSGIQPVEGTYWYTVVYIEVDKSVSGRKVSLKTESGTAYPDTEPVPLRSTDEIFRYRVADIKNYYGDVVEGVVPHSIDFKVGSDELPFVNCPLESISIEDHFKRWEQEFEALEDEHKKLFSNNLDQIMLDWNMWFNTAKTTLDEDVAGNILNLIVEIQNRLNLDERTLTEHSTDISETKSKVKEALIRTGGITIKPITPDAYEHLAVKDPFTLYIVVENLPHSDRLQYDEETGEFHGTGYIPDSEPKPKPLPAP